MVLMLVLLSDGAINITVTEVRVLIPICGLDQVFHAVIF
jgi:hypothetical protein